MFRAHKIALDPTNVQRAGLARAAGVARFTYNWALAHWNDQYAQWTYLPEETRGPRPSQYSVRRDLNAIKREQFPWMLESTKFAPEEAIIDLGIAFKNAFDGRAWQGFDDNGCSPHAWRCENPDRFPGYCTCVDDMIDAILAAGYRKADGS